MSTATKMVLDGTITDKGVVAPVYPSLARTLMNELKNNYGLVLPIWIT